VLLLRSPLRHPKALTAPTSAYCTVP
jgi:hypothetical protein